MHYLIFFTILVVTWPLRWLPYSTIHSLGQFLGTLAYWLLPHFRKRALSNLAMATDLHLGPEEIRKIAKASIQNLMITCLEYPKLASEKKIQRIAHCENPELAEQFIREGKSVIFFCGHQANWEILFLEGTSRMPGIAIGRPIKNKYLYQWVVKMREKFGGKIVSPQLAVKEGLRALKKGCFLGVVGDQGKPDSGFSSPFFGRLAYTSPLPALLACRTGAPIIVATTQRVKDRYLIHYSDPLWPDPEAPLQQEIDRLMRACLSRLEISIQENPEEWLWIHNRWKLQSTEVIQRPFRHESLAIFLPSHRESLKELVPHLPTFRSLYPQETLTFFSPKAHADLAPEGAILYDHPSDLLVTDYRFKLIFNFSGFSSIRSHFKKLGAFTIVDLPQLKKMAGNPTDSSLSYLLKKVICHAP